MQKFLRILKIVSLLFGGVILVAVGVAYLFEDELKAYAFKQIETQLIAHMSVGDSNFSLLSKFPMASLELRDVFIEDPLTVNDTLIFASRAYLSFNPLSLLRGSYVVERLDIEDASINMSESGDGKENYLFWKSSEDSTGTFRFDIDELRIENTAYKYENKRSSVYLDLSAKSLVVKAGFENEVIELEFSGNGQSRSIDLNGLAGLVNESFDLSGKMALSNDSKRIQLDDLILELKAGTLNWTGLIDLLEEGALISGKFELDDCRISYLNNSFPRLLEDVLVHYSINAEVDAEGSIKGLASSLRIPEITADLSISEGYFRHKQSGEELSSVISEASLSLRADKSYSVVAKSLGAEFRHGKLELSGLLENNGVPFVDAEVQGRVRLEEMKSFFGLDTLEKFGGDMELKLSWKGSLPNWKTSPESLDNTELQGSVRFSDAVIKLVGNKREITDLNGKLLMDGQTVAVQSLTGFIGRSDFRIEGFIKNFLAYLSDKEEVLRLEASYFAETIYLDELLDEGDEEDDRGDAYKLGLPTQLSCNLNMEVEELIFKEFRAEDIQCVARMDRGYLKIDPASFRTADGEFLASFALTPKPNGHFDLLCEASVKDISISKLFRSMENFGQNVVTDRHLKGTANADISFSADLDEVLYMDREKIYSLIDISIANGELIGMESLSGISDYLRKNKLIAGFVEVDEFERKLKHIRFSELSNQIEIKNRKVYFPKMEIASSAMDISAYGTHGFENDIDYSITFRIRDVLKKKNSEFGVEEDDGLGSKFFLAMRGTTDNPEFAFDKNAAKAQRMENRESERREFKSILKEEFGLFKKEETLDPSKDQPKDEAGKGKELNITIDWEEEKDTSKINTPETESKKKKSWLERLKEQETETAPPPDDDDDF